MIKNNRNYSLALSFCKEIDFAVHLEFSWILHENVAKIYSVMAKMISISEDDFHSHYWPKLESAINLILQQNPGEFIPISYEETYRYEICFDIKVICNNC